MANYSVTYLHGEVLSTLYFEDEASLKDLLEDIAQRGALIVPSGTRDGGRLYEGNRAIMASRIVSVQDDPM